jgi:hypothetical protein
VVNGKWARIVAINVLLSLNLAATFETGFPFPLTPAD